MSPPRDQSLSPPSSPKDEKEKTIPFLRQLTEMLQNNEELISFVPGQRLPNNKTVQGKIIVHDRNRVQSEVLPVYFNHASFASLRRQLSYFSFVRVGKSRQSGVTYTNDSVVELADIRKLKRRVVGQAGAAVRQQQQRKKQLTAPQQQPQNQLQPRKHQESQEQKQERQLTTTSADVASAVLSGTLHAAKTNHNLDINQNNNSSATAGRPTTLRTSPICHRSSATQSSISQSFETSSSGSSEEANASGGSKNNVKNNKSKVVRKRRTSTPKPAIPRKERARFDKLLSINNIVPFIHLPAGHTLVSSRRSRKKEDGSASTAESGSGGGCYNNKESNGTAINTQKENALSRRERSTSNASGNAINALLALGAHHMSYAATAAPA